MVVSGHHIHALWWGPQASRKWSWRADIYDEKAMPGREPPGCLATFAEILRPGAPVGDFSGPGGVWDVRAPVGATSRTGAPTVGYGWGGFRGASRWVVPQRASVSGM